MPTTVIKTIGPTGDYADFNAAQAAITAAGGSLVALDQVWRLQVQAGEQVFTTQQKIDTVTTDSTRYIVIEPVAGTGFNSNANKLTNSLAYVAANGTAITSSVSNSSLPSFVFSAVSFVQGMQIRRTNQGVVLNVNTSSGTGQINNCIIRVYQPAYDPAIQFGGKMFNCLVMVDLVQTNDPAVLSNRYASGSIVDSVTVVAQPGSATNVALIDSFSSGATVKNTAFFGLQRSYASNTSTFTYCSTDLSTLTGTGNLTGQTTTATFISNTSDFRVKAGATVINAGNRSQTVTNDLDIVGSSRSTTTPTIGAWEYAAAGPSAPTFQTQPSNQSVTAGSTATFTVSSSDATSFQWQRSTDGGTNYTNVATGTGGTTTTFTTVATTVSGGSANNGDMYRCVATNANGSTNSTAATLTVTASGTAPTVTTQPSAQTVTAPNTATFTAGFSGSPTPTYQWQRSTDSGSSWNNISGATSSAYTTPATSVTGGSANNGDRYRCVATNASGSATTNGVTLTVNAPVTGTITYTDPLVNINGTVYASASSITYLIQTLAGSTVVTKTNQTTNSSGIPAAVTDSNITTGTTYRTIFILSGGGEGTVNLTAT